jgi:hypothetical protein
MSLCCFLLAGVGHLGERLYMAASLLAIAQADASTEYRILRDSAWWWDPICLETPYL